MVSAVKAVQASSFRTRVPVLAQLLTLIIDYTILAIYLTFVFELSVIKNCTCAIKKEVEESLPPPHPFSLYDKIHDVTLWKKSDVELWVLSETLYGISI